MAFILYTISRLPVRAQLEDDTYNMQNRQMLGSVENAETYSQCINTTMLRTLICITKSQNRQQMESCGKNRQFSQNMIWQTGVQARQTHTIAYNSQK